MAVAGEDAIEERAGGRVPRPVESPVETRAVPFDDRGHPRAHRPDTQALPQAVPVRVASRVARGRRLGDERVTEASAAWMRRDLRDVPPSGAERRVVRVDRDVAGERVADATRGRA